MRNLIRFKYERPELLAVASVVAALVACALTKVGFAWCGIAIIAALCMLGVIVEQPVLVRKFGQAFVKCVRAVKSVRSDISHAAVPALKSTQA